MLVVLVLVVVLVLESGFLGIGLQVGLKRSTETHRADKLGVLLLSAGDFNNLSAWETLWVRGRRRVRGRLVVL